MEDRFEMIVKNENFSLYGIFDGHGGDVCLPYFMIHAVFKYHSICQ